MSIQEMIDYGKCLRYVDMACAHTIKGERCPQSVKAPGYRVPIMCCQGWRMDHPRAYEHALVSEPYYLTTEDLERILAHCKEHGLEVLITSESIRNPGKCLHVVYHRS